MLQNAHRLQNRDNSRLSPPIVRRPAVREWHAHHNLLFRPIVFLIRRLVFINIHLRLIEHDHYDFAEMKEIPSMTCLILPGERWRPCSPSRSSLRSLELGGLLARYPLSTRCSTLAAREKCGPETRPGSFLGWAKVVFRQFPFRVWNSLVTPQLPEREITGLREANGPRSVARCDCKLLAHCARSPPLRGDRLWLSPVLSKVSGVKHSFRSCCPTARPRNDGSGHPL